MITPPQFLFVHVNKRCNLRCQHCDFWRLDDSDRQNYLPWSRQREILEEFAGMNPAGRVVICGGESMLDLEHYFSIAGTCRRLGLRALSVINGTRVRDERMAERLVGEGPHEISVSLNSQRRELHDETRGLQGAFDKAVRALRLLLKARDRVGNTDTRIYVMGLVFDGNYQELDAFYDFVLNDIGADKLKLNFLQPSFGHQAPEDRFFLDHHGVDPERLVATIRQCDAKYRLGLNPAWINQVGMYFRSLQASRTIQLGWSDRSGTSEHICNSYERNIMVDHYGVARLCFSTLFSGARLNEFGDLRRFWEGAEAIRGAMRWCNHYCGISHSVRRETSTSASRRPVPAGSADGTRVPVFGMGGFPRYG